MALARSDVTHLLEATRAGGDIDVIRERGWSSCSRPSSKPKQQRSSELAATSEARGARHSATVTGTVWLSPRLAMESLRILKAPPRELLPEHPRAPPSGRSRPRRRRHGGLRPGGEHRQVDDLAAALGGTGISKSEVSRIVASLDEEMAGFRTRRLDHLRVPVPPSPMPPTSRVASSTRWS